MAIDWGQKIGAPTQEREHPLSEKQRQPRGLGFVSIAQSFDPCFAAALTSFLRSPLLLRCVLQTRS
jgi:hypothetical protein